MPRTWTVQQGDCIHSLAWRFGIPWRTLWDANRGLESQHREPGVLMPGDVVQIPEIRRERQKAPSAKNTRFKAPLPRLELRFALYAKGKPRPHLRCKVRLGTKEHLLTTNEHGAIDVPVAPDDDAGTLTVFPEGKLVELYAIRVGGLDPITEPTGVQARLAHLGFDVGPVDGVLGPRTKGAIAAFQAQQHLTATGVIDAATRSKLAATHDETAS